MLIAGLPPIDTLATNKLQSLFGSGSATLAYARGGHVELRSQLPMAIMSALGSALGAALTTFVPGDVLKALAFCFKAINTKGFDDPARARRILEKLERAR